MTRESRPRLDQDAFVQRVGLDAYNNSDPRHDPSRLSNTLIEATDEYRTFSTFTFPPLVVPYATAEEARLACRLLLRHLREGGSVVPYSSSGLSFLFIDRAKKQLGTLRSAERQSGHLNWVPFNTSAAVHDPSRLPTEFGRWVLAGGPQPSAMSGSVNCWEMVLLGAFRAGYLPFPRIQEIYRRAADNVRAGRATLVGTTVEAELRQGARENVFDPADADSPSPLPGDIVIFDTAANHMAISLGTRTSAGRHEVLSLWNRPGNNFHVQRTTIEDLLAAGASGPVKFWSARW